MLLRVTRDISVFYIDTGFLFDQTYELRDKLQKKYGFEFLRFSTEVTPEKQTEMYGEKLWEKDPDICCSIRKVIPLKMHCKITIFGLLVFGRNRQRFEINQIL